MRMGKRTFRIGELAKQLNVERFVIRFWEKEFALKSIRSDGKQRFYTQDDLKKFALIKELLYDKKYTIAGARNTLQEQGKKSQPIVIVPSKKLDLEATPISTLNQHLIVLREQLKKLYNML